MKKNNDNFELPSRESPLAILFILGKTLYNIVTRIWPALIVIFFRDKKDNVYEDYLLWAVIIVASVAMVFSIINYFKTFYFIRDNELFLQKGVLQKTKTNIPFERIQTVQFEQSVLHAIFGVVKLKMDTAGSDKTEIDFYAVEINKAERLREIILKHKGVKGQTDLPKWVERDKIQILHLNISDLLKVGLTRNHLKSGGVILVFLAWVYDNIKELGVDADEYYEEVVSPRSDITFYVYLLILFLIVSVLISLIRSVIYFFDLRLIRVVKGFRMIAGFFTKKEISALDHKIQMVSWSDNMLKRKLGYFDVRLLQASSQSVENKQKILIPGMNQAKIDSLALHVFSINLPDKNSGKPIQFLYFTRFFWIMTIGLSMLLLSLVWLQMYYWVPVTLIIYGLLILSRYLQFRKKSYTIHEGCMTIRGGSFGEKNVLFPLYKLQAVGYFQSPYQQRKNVASIRFYLASGSVVLPYVTLEEAIGISDTALYYIESSRKKWM